MAGAVLITAGGRVVLGSGGGVAVNSASTPAGVIPGAPMSLAVGAKTSTTIALSWAVPATGTPPFTAYFVIFSTSATGPWTTFGTVSGTSTTVTGLSATTTYYFAVAAKNAYGTGAYTTAASAATSSATPVLTGVSPVSGTTAGGTALTLTGSNFSIATSVTVAGSSVAFSIVNDTTITLTAPAHAAGAASISVIGPGGSSGTVSYTYTTSPAPTLSSVLPTSGTTSGGTALTLTGSHFSGATSVTIGGSSVSFTVVSDTSITLTAPAHTAGAVSITVTNSIGTSGGVTFTYTATSSGTAPKWATVSPWVVQSAAGATITVTGSAFTGAAVIDPGTGQPIPATVVNDNTITFSKPGTGPGYYPYEYFIRNSAGDSSRFGLITGITTPTTTTDDMPATVLSGANMTVYGYTYPVGTATSVDLKNNSNSSLVHTYVVNPTNGDGSWSVTFPAPAPGVYFIHSATATSGTDYWTGAFTSLASLTAPLVTGVHSYAKVPGIAAPMLITGSGFTGSPSVKFGSVVATNHTVVNDSTITLPSAPDQAFGVVNITVTGASGEASNTTPFQYLHAIVEPVPQSVGGAAPVVPSRWKGPWTAVNAPKSGQVTSITVDPVHGNSAGTGSDGTSNNLWSTFGFLAPSFGPSSNYPMLADGGTIHIRAGTFAPGTNARGHSADFPGGINIIGVGADQVILNNYGNGPGGDKAMTIWHCNTYFYGIDFRMNGVDEATSGYGAIRFYNDTGTSGSATAHYMHVEKCRFNQCEEAIVSDTGWTTTGENWCLYSKDCDFSPLIQDAYNSDILSHEVYSGAQQFWENCNSYGPKYGTTHKGRSPSMTIVNCWTRRTLNRWIDYPESGVFQAWNSTFTESAPQQGDGGDTDMHVFEYCSTTPDLTVAPTSPLFNNCDLWFSRGVDISNGGTAGEDWMTPIAINFVNCRAHWSNVNGAPPKIWSVDPADFSTHNERIIGIPLSNPGTTFETLPAAPALRTP